MHRALIPLLVLCAAAASCRSRIEPEPLQLDGNRLTIDNRTSQTWNDVVVHLNTYYQVTTPSIAAGSRFQVGLDSFTAGFGQRFDFKRMQVHDLRLTATQADGRPVELKKDFAASGLAGALKGKP
jgi:hypothetical protein